ncbi:hypothetical protein RR46_03891 [Papilio xuthus]|uniref:Uncharacterized protein n=1 Tax=Papilio xuthus TaxID=66420 RepID=A0A194Q1V3_PAPXU|nr:hypothetical protein RR46_03891 [Papilio xuthus]
MAGRGACLRVPPPPALSALLSRRAAPRRQCAGGSGLRRSCSRSPLVDDPACSANDFVFMALILLQVLVLGVTAAAVDGACTRFSPGHHLARAGIGLCLQRPTHAPLSGGCRSNTGTNYGGSIYVFVARQVSLVVVVGRRAGRRGRCTGESSMLSFVYPVP